MMATAECLLWERSTSSSGYGMHHNSDTGRSGYAHRTAYEAFYGPIPEGAVVMHECDERLCYNPLHLRVGSDSDNMRDCVEKGRHPETHKTHCPAGHPYEGDNLIMDGTYRRCRECRNSQARARSRWLG